MEEGRGLPPATFTPPSPPTLTTAPPLSLTTAFPSHSHHEYESDGATPPILNLETLTATLTLALALALALTQIIGDGPTLRGLPGYEAYLHQWQLLCR